MDKIQEILMLQDLKSAISYFGYGGLNLKTLDALKAEAATRLEKAKRGTPFDTLSTHKEDEAKPLNEAR